MALRWEEPTPKRHEAFHGDRAVGSIHEDARGVWRAYDAVGRLLGHAPWSHEGRKLVEQAHRRGLAG